MAAHEHLRACPEASPHHVALYWALFFAWNAGYFENGFDLDHAAVMQAAHIGNKRTYTATLYDLETWGLLTYQPSRSKHHASRCYLTELPGAKVPQVETPTRGKSATDKKPSPVAEVPQALRADLPPIDALPVAVLPQDSLLVQTSFQTSTTNVGGGTKKKQVEVFSGEGFSEAQVLDDTASFNEPVPVPGAAPKKKVAPKKKGVGQGPQAPLTSVTAEPRRRGGRPQRPELPFTESELATPEAFAAAFEGSDYALADLRYYHALVANWRKDGEPPLRRDWKATATKFMLNDAADNRLKLAPGTQRHEPGNSIGSTVDGIPVTGYRSKRWD
ncbi:hypothetical protein E4631_15515 [Hymenobacter sp. UV11]|nr:hypothetical protein [Hymenobacter sp. UV11]TFZ65626.1 hypothetical protein E4631_15515 [Hymenobacter sp. UV11]